MRGPDIVSNVRVSIDGVGFVCLFAFALGSERMILAIYFFPDEENNNRPCRDGKMDPLVD